MTIKPMITVCLAILLAATAQSASPARPNILFILTEDQGAQTGFVGTPGLQTPHMDSLARSGIYFNNAFVAYPVCSASKAAIYTGLHNHANGILNNTLNYHKSADKLTEAEQNNTLLEGNPEAKGADFVFAEISNRGTLPNDGMQKRNVFDGRWKLIYREKLTPPWRQVQEDSKEWIKWGNRTYAETLRVKDQYPDAFRILTEMDPQSLGGKVPALEL